MIEELQKNLLELRNTQDEYLKIARNDENLNEQIRAIQKQIQELKNK